MISEPRTSAIVKRQDLCTRFDENLSPQNGPLTPGTHHASSSSVTYLAVSLSRSLFRLSVCLCTPPPLPPLPLHCSKENNYGTEGIRTALQLQLPLKFSAAESSHAAPRLIARARTRLA